MSEENLKTFRRGFAAVNHRDLDGFLANVAPDVEFMSLIAEAEGETFHGHEGVRRWWKEVVLPLGGLHGGPGEDVRDLGDTVVARVVAIYHPSGVEVRQTIWCATRYRDGMATWWGFFRTEADALEAAGLKE